MTCSAPPVTTQHTIHAQRTASANVRFCTAVGCLRACTNVPHRMQYVCRQSQQKNKNKYWVNADRPGDTGTQAYQEGHHALLTTALQTTEPYLTACMPRARISVTLASSRRYHAVATADRSHQPDPDRRSHVRCIEERGPLSAFVTAPSKKRTAVCPKPAQGRVGFIAILLERRRYSQRSAKPTGVSETSNHCLSGFPSVSPSVGPSVDH